ncbi:chromosome segregation protein SMC [Vulgatibacter incomptus]|uniref:Chromosome partition protein Smc n=1 Tax=Vulgatibacter incomptus TaxID=1391653 RepID=A0A0K1PDA6_9BACT|nr:chromosome segregation protein SMC [Vulgatibacter incomptus]AKU91386.1 Chromosome partition protein smc [Vulgatibacter incomptus]
MRIKRLDICGFKSFMSKTVFVFDDGVTGIVGPNGCGKSNVVDAIRWVMGEQSAKHLRGRAMEDVIFNGSEKHPPLGMAEVSITFINDRGDVPTAYKDVHEITVTRRLFRSGESEYLLNKAPCRLLDIIELFLGTGVGTKAYSIIEQGRIGLIVSAKAEDRRSLIEEAAGITKYKARRKAAERKMEYTEQNLLRLNDILGELGKRLEVLNRQARKAEKYRAIKAELRQIELHLASLRWLELQALRKVSHARHDDLENEQRTLSAEVQRLEVEIASARHAVAEEAAAVEEQSERVAGLSQGSALNQTNLDFFERERRQVQQRQAELDDELARLDARMAALDEEAAAARALGGQLDGRGGTDTERLGELAGQVEELRAEEGEAISRLDAERAAAMEVLSRAASLKGELLTIDRRRGDLVDRMAVLQAEAEGIEHDVDQLEKERRTLSSKAGQTRQLKLELETRRGEETELREQVRAELFESEQVLIALREELADKRSRLHSLVEIQRSYEGYDRGVRAVMTRDGADEGTLPEGVIGLVSDLLSAAEEHERAIESVLADRLQAIVVDSHGRAVEIASYLADAREGRSSFLPLGLRSRERVKGLDDPRVVARAADVVRAEQAHLGLVEALLGDVLIVDHLDDAVALWSRETGHTFVTRAGEVVSAIGGVTGGEADGPGSGLLQKRREVAELGEEVRSLEERVAVAAEEHRRLSRRADEIEQSLKSLEKTGHAEEINLLHAERDLGRATEELARLRARADQLVREREAQQNQLGLLDVEAEAARGATAQAEAERSRREERTAQLAAEVAAVREQLTTISAEHTRLKIEAAANVERREAIERTLKRVAEERVQIDERKERARASIAEGDARLAELAGKVEEASGSITSLADELATAREELARLKSEHTVKSGAIAAQEQELRGHRKRLDELGSVTSSAALRDRELELELQHLEEGITERHNLSLAEQVFSFHSMPPPEEGAEDWLSSLRDQVDRMGEVNLTAVEEHAELAERHDFLSGQRDDLEKSLAKLRQAISRIDSTSKERFNETFEIVNSKFQQVFPRLFGGGRAELLLVKDETRPGGDPGVEIFAQPPGKKNQNVNLMSGGEKALTAVSLIFAIFLIKPTPFCLLDEVDAPLDEANVGRYNDMVKEMSKTSQFILITHNKRTMEVGDTLYGVTMEEPGVSKTVSVKLSRGDEGANPDSEKEAAA